MRFSSSKATQTSARCSRTFSYFFSSSFNFVRRILFSPISSSFETPLKLRLFEFFCFQTSYVQKINWLLSFSLVVSFNGPLRECLRFQLLSGFKGMFSQVWSSFTLEDMREGLYEETRSVFLLTTFPLDFMMIKLGREEEGKRAPL